LQHLPSTVDQIRLFLHPLLYINQSASACFALLPYFRISFNTVQSCESANMKCLLHLTVIFAIFLLATANRSVRQCKSRQARCEGLYERWQQEGGRLRTDLAWTTRNYCCNDCWTKCITAGRESRKDSCGLRAKEADPRQRTCCEMGWTNKDGKC